MGQVNKDCSGDLTSKSTQGRLGGETEQFLCTTPGTATTAERMGREVKSERLARSSERKRRESGLVKNFIRRRTRPCAEKSAMRVFVAPISTAKYIVLL